MSVELGLYAPRRTTRDLLSLALVLIYRGFFCPMRVAGGFWRPGLLVVFVFRDLTKATRVSFYQARRWKEDKGGRQQGRTGRNGVTYWSDCEEAQTESSEIEMCRSPSCARGVAWTVLRVPPTSDPRVSLFPSTRGMLPYTSCHAPARGCFFALSLTESHPPFHPNF